MNTHDTPSNRLVYTGAKDRVAEPSPHVSSFSGPFDEHSSLRLVAIVVPIVSTIIILLAVIFLVIRFRRRQPKRKKRTSIYKNPLTDNTIIPYTLRPPNLVGSTLLGLSSSSSSKSHSLETITTTSTTITANSQSTSTRRFLPFPVTTSTSSTRASLTIRTPSAEENPHPNTNTATDNGPQPAAGTLFDIDPLVDLVIQRLTRWTLPSRISGRVPSVPPPSYSV